MPNIQGYDQAPILGDASAAERGGMISGLIQIGSAVGAAGLGAMGSRGGSGGAGGGGYSTGMGGSSSNVGDFTNLPVGPGDISGGLGFA